MIYYETLNRLLEKETAEQYMENPKIQKAVKILLKEWNSGIIGNPDA